MLKFREAPLVKESLASLEKAVPSPTEEDEPDAGRNKIPAHDVFWFHSMQYRKANTVSLPSFMGPLELKMQDALRRK